MLLPEDFVVWDKEIGYEDLDLVGSEIATISEFLKGDFDTLPHLILTQSAFEHFKDANFLSDKIKHLLGSVNIHRHDSIVQVSSHLKKLFNNSEIPPEVFKEFYKKFEIFRSYKVSIKVFYFHKKKIIKTALISDLKGESTVIEKIRHIWSDIFSIENLASYKLHHENFNDFSAVVAITPNYNFEVNGHVKHTKSGEYHIEAYSMVRFVYNKHQKKITDAKVLENGSKNALSVGDIKKLIDISKRLEKIFVIPQIAYWGKLKGDFFVTKILPQSDEVNFKDTYNTLEKSLTVCPGVTIGRLRVIDPKQGVKLVLNDEIVVVKKLDKKMAQTISRAKGVILHEMPEPEVVEILKKVGIPTLVRGERSMLYSTGDVVSLNATTGEIKRGNMLVS